MKDKQSIDHILNELNTIFREDIFIDMCWDSPNADGNGTSYKQHDLPEHTIVILGSSDFTYYHTLEIVLSGVIAHNLPQEGEFRGDDTEPQIVLIEDSDKEEILTRFQLPINSNYFVFGLGSWPSEERYYLVAEDIKQKTRLVFYYEPENLQPGEKLAWWVKKGKEKVE